MASLTLPDGALYSPLARYKLDEVSGNALDSVGSLDFTDTNTVGSSAAGAYTNGDAEIRFDYARDLDRGATEHFALADGTALDFNGAQDFGWGAWLKIGTAPTSGQVFGIFSKWAGSNEQIHMHYRNNSGTMQLRAGLSSTGSSTTYKEVDYTLTAGVWVYVCMFYDASAGAVSFWTDGTQEGSTQTGYPTSLYDGSADVEIGSRDGTSTESFDGMIQDMSIWNELRTAAEINTIHDAYTQLRRQAATVIYDQSANLQGHWKLNNDYADASGNSNTLTATGSPVFTTTAPKEGTHSLDLEAGSSQRAAITDASQTGLDITGDMTYIAWVTPESQPSSSTQNLFSKAKATAGDDFSYWLGYNHDGSNTRYQASLSSDGTSSTTVNQNVTLNNAERVMVGMAYDASEGTIDFYKNGQNIGQQTGLPTSIHNSAAGFLIGAFDSASPGSFWDGLMDDVQVYDAKFTDAQMAAAFDYYRGGIGTFSTSDGWVGRQGVSEAWGTIRGAASGTLHKDHADGTSEAIAIRCSTTSNEWDLFRKAFFSFWTAGIPTGATIDSASLWLYVNSKTETLASQSIVLCDGPADSNEALVNDDFNNPGTTAWSDTKALSDITTGQYNEITFNATGLAGISDTAHTAFSARFESDRANSEPTYSSGQAADVNWSHGNHATNPPILEIAYTESTGLPAARLLVGVGL